MPMDDKALTKDILNTFRSNMKKLHPQAEPREFQEKLSKAVAKGTINVIKASKVKALSPAPTLVGKTGQGLVVDKFIMKNAAILAMLGFIGGTEGIALDKMMESMLFPISTHLAKNVVVTSTTGFGGQGGAPIGATAKVFEAAILKELPADIRQKMLLSKQGIYLVRSISIGLSTGVAVGIPGLVPFGSTPPAAGVMIATLS